MPESQYVLPPEYHWFERDAKHLAIDPQNFIWFVTDEKGKVAFEGLAKSGRIEDAAESLGALVGMSADSPAITNYVVKYIEHLLEIGFLHKGEYKREKWGSGIIERPIVMYIHLTSKCNLKCPYCYNQEHRDNLIQEGRTPGEAGISTEGSTEDLLRVVDEAAELGFREIKLTGGEALLNRDALHIAERAKSHGLKINLLTNGLLVTEEMAEKIAKVVDSVSVSLDSDKPEEHDAVRGKGTHAKVVEAIHRLQKAGVKRVHLNSVVTPVNLNSVGSWLDYATNELKANEVTYAGSAIDVDDPTGRWGASEYVLTEEQYRHVYEQSKKFYQIQGLRKGSKPQVVPRSSLRRRQCGVGNGIVSIDPNGDLYPCQTLHLPEFRCGNVFKTSLRQVLDTSGMLKKMKRAAVDNLPECKTCPVRYICAGGCRSEAYTREGDLLARNRAMCPTFFEMAKDRLWDSANIPVEESRQSVEKYFEQFHTCH
ncbi:MAG TPA: radical SAM protein [Pyrinomonadaceae bacterium]|nr:radical SAM protein [Pyrinomonadaceae bacterium]